jgi:hypothetical protein
VRSAAGSADHAELIQPQRIGDIIYVTCGIRDCPTLVSDGPAVPRAVVADEADPEPVQNARPRYGTAAAARRSVQQEYWHSR